MVTQSNKCIAHATIFMLKNIMDYFFMTVFTWRMVVYRVEKGLIERISEKDLNYPAAFTLFVIHRFLIPLCE